MFRIVLGTVLLAGASIGQQTWVVDVLGSGDFTNLPPAVAAAAAGDTILVISRLGLPVDWNLTLAKGLTIVGVGGDQAQATGHLVIANLPANERVVLRSLQLNVLGYDVTRLTVQDCAGMVVLDSVTLDGAWQQPFAVPALIVANSRRVHLENSQMTGAPALRATASVVTLTGSSALGSNVVSGPGTTGIAVDAAGSRLSFADCYLVGGSNHDVGGFSGPGETAVMLAGSPTTFAGTACYGGTGFDGYAAAVILDASSSVVADEATTFGTPIAGGGTVASAETGVLTGWLAPTSSYFALDAAPDSIGFLLLSLPGPEIPTLWGSYWLAWLPVPIALGRVPVERTLPPLWFLPHGFPLAVQGLVLHDGELRLSTPLVATAP